MASLFARQLATYGGYHRDRRNRATHFIGIPGHRVRDIACRWRWCVLDGISSRALGHGAGLDRLDRARFRRRRCDDRRDDCRCCSARNGSRASKAQPRAWIVFAIFFTGGWIFQLVGHAWEGRRPALADNLFQAFIGPMFLMAEVLMAIGLASRT